MLAILVMSGLVVWLTMQLRAGYKDVLATVIQAMEMVKASSIEEHVAAQALKGREALYQRQLEDELARVTKTKPPAPAEPEQIEVIDDKGTARLIDYSKLEALGPDDISNLS